MMVTDDGLAESEKFGAAEIVSEIGTVCAPELPETVSGKVPVGDVPPTFVVIVSVEAAELFDGGVTEVGLNTHVVDAGQPVTVRPTGLLNPLSEFTVMVEAPAFP